MLRFIIPCFSIKSDLKLRKFLGKIRMACRKIYSQHHRFWLSNHQRNTCKKSWSNSIVCEFLQGIWDCKRRSKYNSIWSLRRDALQKHENNGSLNQWWYRLLQNYCWSLARDTLASYLFVISLDYILQMSIDLIKDDVSH